MAIVASSIPAAAEPKPFAPSISATGDDEVPPLGNAPAVKPSSSKRAASKPAPAKPESKPETIKPEASKPESVKPEAKPFTASTEATTADKKPAAEKSAGDKPPVKMADPTDEPTPLEINPNQDYQGVVPGSDNLPPKPPKLPVAGVQRLTWCGFRMVGETPTVFFQTTATPDYQISESKGEVRVTFRNTKLNLRNNGRSLRTEAFQTDVKRVDLKPARGKSLLVRIKTAGSAAPAHREHVESSAGGFSVLTVEFPPAAPADEKLE